MIKAALTPLTSPQRSNITRFPDSSMAILISTGDFGEHRVGEVRMIGVLDESHHGKAVRLGSTDAGLTRLL